MLLLKPTIKAISERQAKYLCPSVLLNHATSLDEPNNTAIWNTIQHTIDCKYLTAQWWNEDVTA